MVERKLEEQGHEPQNVQVIFGITYHDVFLLQDEDGVFLRIETEEEAPVDEPHFSSEFQSADLQEELQSRLRMPSYTTKWREEKLITGIYGGPTTVRV